jgi:glutamate-5-semialdehyde dehydrogenase
MVDRLKLTPKVIETVAVGCEQLAVMPTSSARSSA